MIWSHTHGYSKIFIMYVVEERYPDMIINHFECTVVHMKVLYASFIDYIFVRF